jgi:hypothetical protein
MRILLRLAAAMASAIFSSWVRSSATAVGACAARTADAEGMDVLGAVSRATGVAAAVRVTAINSVVSARVTCISASCAARMAIASFWRDWLIWLSANAPTEPMANVTAPTATIQGRADDFWVVVKS